VRKHFLFATIGKYKKADVIIASLGGIRIAQIAKHMAILQLKIKFRFKRVLIWAGFACSYFCKKLVALADNFSKKWVKCKGRNRFESLASTK
jgi:hypothetical protein